MHGWRMDGQALFFQLNWMTLSSAHNFLNLPCWFCRARRDHPLYGVMTLGPNTFKTFLYWSWTASLWLLDCLGGQGGFINLVDTPILFPLAFVYCFCLCASIHVCHSTHGEVRGQFKGSGSSPPLHGSQWLNSDIILGNENFTLCLSHPSWLPLTFM